MDTSLGYATVIAQVIPVLLLAAVAVPLRTTKGASTRRGAFVDLVVTGSLTGAALIAEFAALFGVFHGGLSRADTRLLTWLLIVTALLATMRLIAPVASSYADQTGVPGGRVWRILGGVVLASAIGFLYVLNALTR